MASASHHETQTEAVAVFDDADTLQAAIDDLLGSGFDRAELSLLASETAVQDKLGHAYRKASELEDDPSVPRADYISVESIGDAQGGLIGGLMYVGALAAAGAVLASGGALAAAVVSGAMAGGAGGVFGAALGKLIGDHHARHLQEQLDHGGLLLWVGTRDDEHEARAVKILSRHSAHDVHLHALPAATD